MDERWMEDGWKMDMEDGQMTEDGRMHGPSVYG
jgi:hypothetical protein